VPPCDLPRVFSRKPEFALIYHLPTAQVNQIETHLRFLDELIPFVR